MAKTEAPVKRGRGRPFGSKSARKKGVPLDLDKPLSLCSESFKGIRKMVAYRAAVLRAKGALYRELPAILASEFGIEEPGLDTIVRWLNEADAVITKDFAALQERVRMDTFHQLESIKAAWLPRAQGHLSINRTEMTQDGWKTVLDENSFAEQQKAAKVVLDCISQQCKLLKLNLVDEVKATGGMDIMSLQLWITDRAAGITREMGEAKVVSGPVLELESGVELLVEAQP